METFIMIIFSSIVWFMVGRMSATQGAYKALEKERERCAKLAEAHYIPGHAVASPEFAASLAEKIRE